MDKKIREMIINVTKINLIISIPVSIVISIVNLLSGIAFFTGTLIAIINFVINSIVVNKSFSAINKKKIRLIMQLSFIFRMLLILFVAVLFKESYVNIILYLIGFIFHQIAIFIYARKK
ncbi:MAG: ATP synthase subunit I [Sarcina sp.]